MKIFIDEAGRGPLAWPLYVGLIKEDIHWDFETIDQDFQDSKALSEKKREHSYALLMQMKDKGLKLATGQANSSEIDRYGVTKAINIAIIRGLYQIFSSDLEGLKKEGNPTFDMVRTWLSEYLNNQNISLLIDGKMDFGLRKDLNIPVETLIKWDSKIRGIAMASILAKVERDQSMTNLSQKYPERDFDQHKGYGTKKHYQKIDQFWTCNEHRRLFLKKLFPNGKLEKFDWNLPFTENPC